MSAPSPMNRIVVVLIALTALNVACASGAEVSAKTHWRTPARSHARAAYHQTTTRKVHHAVEAQTQHRGAEKQSPEEVGRAAGLAIRRGVEQNRPGLRNLVYHRRSSRSNLRPVSIRRLRRPVRTDSGQPVEATLTVASATSYSGRNERAASRTAVSGSGAKLRSAAVEPVRERASAQAGETPDAMQEFAGKQAARESEPGPGAESAVMEHPADAQGTASNAPDAVDDVPEGGSARVAEQASLYISRGAMPRPLYGTVASLDRQNQRLEAEGLERIEDESDLEARIAGGLLVRVPVSDALAVNEDLPETHRYCRPWTALFLKDLAREHEAAFHKPLEVSSAVRTVEYQRRLMATNGNAAPAQGDVVSPHLTGATVDIAKKGMSRKEIAWMRRRLLAFEDTGKIDVEEEFYQACFHITVYENYVPARALHPPSRATSPVNRPRQQPEPSETNTDAAAATGL